MEDKVKEEAERIIGLFDYKDLGSFPRFKSKRTIKKDAIIYCEGIIENSNNDLKVCKELHPHAGGLVAGNIVWWNQIKEFIEKNY